MFKLDVIIEIPKGSNLKYEYDRSTKEITIDRKLDGEDVYPQAYGFIPEALDWDGDELDVLVFSSYQFKSGNKVSVRIIGAMEMVDDGEKDTKLLAVDLNDKSLNGVNDLKDIDKKYLDEIRYFFETYKRFRKQLVIVNDFKNVKWAIHEYHECVALMNKYRKLSKTEFIKLMRQQHPEKYSK